MDETGANYTEWSKPERKTPIRYTNKHIYMEFRKMVTITLYVRQQKRHRCIEQCFGLCGRGQGWNDLGEWHWNMYNITYEMNHQSRFNAWYWMLGASALRTFSKSYNLLSCLLKHDILSVIFPWWFKLIIKAIICGTYAEDVI